MIRAGFSAVGITMGLWGASLFYVEAVTLKPGTPPNPLLSLVSHSTSAERTIQFAQWLPHTLIGVGVVTILYAIALPRSAKH